MSGPLQELRTDGRLGPLGADLLYRTVAAVARSRNFPPPGDHQRWDDDAVAEVAHDFLGGDRGVKRLADLVVRSTSERVFSRLLNQAVVNFLRDIGRRTEFGRLIRRINAVLASPESGFTRVAEEPARWALAEGPTEATAVPAPRLARAAAQVIEINIPSWESERRRAPAADAATFLRLARAVLEAAEGSVEVADLAHAIAARLDVARVPLTLELEVIESFEDPIAGSEDTVVSRMHAQEIFKHLSEQQRLLLATWERPLRELDKVVGVRRSQAQVLRDRLATRLSEELGDDEEYEMTVNELMAAARRWLVERTTGHDPTYTRD